MSTLEHGLGGRLPLLEPEKLQSKQRELYGKINSGVVPLAAAAGFEGRDEQGHLIGPFNATLYSPEICGSFLALFDVWIRRLACWRMTLVTRGWAEDRRGANHSLEKNAPGCDPHGGLCLEGAL